jgi:regulator of protease activity HflC (stomatin/prohibitin superfamily)
MTSGGPAISQFRYRPQLPADYRRSAKIFGQQNTTTISENRERLSTSLKVLLSTDLGRLYGIEVVDFQIARITYSDSFRTSVEAAVKAKNEAVAAENTVNRIRFEAQQAVARANGEAEAKLRIADADRQAAILKRAGQRRSDPPRRRVPGQRAAAERRGPAHQCLGRRARQGRSVERYPASDLARRSRGHAASQAPAEDNAGAAK